MATTQGTAIVWGCSTTDITGFTAAVTGATTTSSEDFSSESDKVELKSKSGEIQTVYWFNGRNTLSLKCYPSGASASATALPTLGEKVTVTASSDSDIAGDYICDGVSKSRKQDGIVEFDLSLISYDGITPA